MQVVERTRLRRHPERAVVDRAVVDAILDEALHCHVGVLDGDAPVVIPSVHGRDGDTLYLHGSAVGRFLQAAATTPLCVTVTLLDGLVLSRSAFGHSMNYRSVMVFGEGRLVTDAEEKLRALRCITEHLVPGRWDEVRKPTRKELNTTAVVAVQLDELSCKVRAGGPVDPSADRVLPIWAGELPLRTVTGLPVAAPESEALPLPESMRA